VKQLERHGRRLLTNSGRIDRGDQEDLRRTDGSALWAADFDCTNIDPIDTRDAITLALEQRR